MSNSKYFDFLDAILQDCKFELPTFDDTILLKETCVNVLYQLILICPAALITTVLPRIISVLVDMIYLCTIQTYFIDFIDFLFETHLFMFRENSAITANLRDSSYSSLSLLSYRIRCLSSIYPLVNVITSTSLLTPIFTGLDSHGWYPMSFVRSILRPLTNTKVIYIKSRLLIESRWFRKAWISLYLNAYY